MVEDIEPLPEEEPTEIGNAVSERERRLANPSNNEDQTIVQRPLLTLDFDSNVTVIFSNQRHITITIEER